VGASANIDRETSPAMVTLIDQEKDGNSGMNKNSQIQIHRVI